MPTFEIKLKIMKKGDFSHMCVSDCSTSFRTMLTLPAMKHCRVITFKIEACISCHISRQIYTSDCYVGALFRRSNSRGFRALFHFSRELLIAGVCYSEGFFSMKFIALSFSNTMR